MPGPVESELSFESLGARVSLVLDGSLSGYPESAFLDSYVPDLLPPVVASDGIPGPRPTSAPLMFSFKTEPLSRTADAPVAGPRRESDAPPPADMSDDMPPLPTF